MGDTAGQREALRLLEQNRVSFQREIAHRIKLKFTPVLGFRLDLTLAQADRVLAIIDQLQREEGPAPASAEVPPALG
jgi:ribosome-binding factor A